MVLYLQVSLLSTQVNVFMKSENAPVAQNFTVNSATFITSKPGETETDRRERQRWRKIDCRISNFTIYFMLLQNSSLNMGGQPEFLYPSRCFSTYISHIMQM